MRPLPYRFHPEAEAEFLAAIDWYAARDADVATDFAALVRDAVLLIAELPQACRPGLVAKTCAFGSFVASRSLSSMPWT